MKILIPIKTNRWFLFFSIMIALFMYFLFFKMTENEYIIPWFYNTKPSTFILTSINYIIYQWPFIFWSLYIINKNINNFYMRTLILFTSFFSSFIFFYMTAFPWVIKDSIFTRNIYYIVLLIISFTICFLYYKILSRKWKLNTIHQLINH